MFRVVFLLTIGFYWQAIAVETALDLASKTEQEVAPNSPILAFELTGLKDEVYRKNALAFLDIDDDNGKPIANLSYADYLTDLGVQQIQESLQPFGYYLAQVKPTVRKTPKKWTISYQVKKGPPVKVNNIDLVVNGEGGEDAGFADLLNNYPLKKGDILLQEKYTDFKNKLLSKALNKGYFDGLFTQTQIILSDNLQSADIHITYDSGKRYAIGKTHFKQNFLDDDVFQRYVNYEEGEVYTSKDIADLQRDLYNSGYIKIIDLKASPDKTAKAVPIELKLTPKKNKKHTFAIGYGTDTGARARYDFDWRWVNRRGHQFKTRTFVSEKLIAASAEYRIPALRPATDYYKLFANVEKDSGGDVDSTLWNIGGAYHDTVGNLTREVGVFWQQEDFTLGNDKGNVGLLVPYVDLSYRRADNVLNVGDGVLISGRLSGAHTSMLSDVSFLQAVAKAKYVKRIGDVNKFTVSGAIGKTWVDNFHQLPADYRFFTGGDKTIRGYSYNSIGDRDSSGANIGGDKMYRISGEYEYFFKDNMSAAVFVDAGDVYSDRKSSLKVGAGAGVRYYSPIGPIKIDIAHGFDKPGDEFRFHFSIGPEL